MSDDILILSGEQVGRLLVGRESEIIDEVRRAYLAHGRGADSLPHSTFLRFPNQQNRIIALPAYLGDKWEVAGLKWVASFPGNLESGLDRASALLILNSPQTGRPEAVIEGAIISAKRTAAGAALAAQSLHLPEHVNPVGVIGCGLINFETVRFLLATLPEINRFLVYDLNPSRAEHFKKKCRNEFAEIDVESATDLRTVLRRSPLISLATTATTPHIDDLSETAPGTVILHISLRDFAPQVILSCDNIVDDIDHVCRAETSIHLAEQLVGRRDFIRSTLADIMSGKARPRNSLTDRIIFSPFGLGVLDLVVGKMVLDLALEPGEGTAIHSFFPKPFA